MLSRLVQHQIEAALFKGKTLVIFGPRQVGKTTLAKAILEAHPAQSAYVSFSLRKAAGSLSVSNSNGAAERRARSGLSPRSTLAAS
ncbi:MAG: AAA family ATPase [Verrucomicrobia bacterium]|nr:AAA family ATPase [Verrucomicrobiota bacterium]